jgi:hypothetical protein
MRGGLALARGSRYISVDFPTSGADRCPTMRAGRRWPVSFWRRSHPIAPTGIFPQYLYKPLTSLAVLLTAQDTSGHSLTRPTVDIVDTV